MSLVLASKSPRRQELFKLITETFEIDVADVDEDNIKATLPSTLAKNIAFAKAEAVFAKRQTDVVIGCDTVVELENEVFGKPKNEKEIVGMISKLSGNAHKVHTGVCIVLPNGKKTGFVSTTQVHFAKISQKDILEYSKTKEALDKAGGYGIQGWAAKYTTKIDGCYYNVMGLPVSALYEALQALKIYA